MCCCQRTVGKPASSKRPTKKNHKRIYNFKSAVRHQKRDVNTCWCRQIDDNDGGVIDKPNTDSTTTSSSSSTTNIPPTTTSAPDFGTKPITPSDAPTTPIPDESEEDEDDEDEDDEDFFDEDDESDEFDDDFFDD